MENKEYIKNQIDPYLLGDLEETASDQFLLEIKKYPDLEEELKIRKDLMHGIDTFVYRDIKSRLQNIQQEVNLEEAAPPSVAPIAPPVSIRRSLFRNLAIAATFVLLFSVSYWVFQSNEAVEQDLFATYYQPYEDLFSVRNQDASDGLLLKANEAYLNNDYAAALPNFESLLQSKSDETKLLLATGICQLETGDIAGAITRFQSIIQLKDIYLTDQAIWYTAMAHLKQKDTESAKKMLQQLTARTDADHYQEAKKILERL